MSLYIKHKQSYVCCSRLTVFIEINFGYHKGKGRVGREKKIRSMGLTDTCVCVKSLQLCPTLCDSMDYSPPDSSYMGFSSQEYWSRLSFPSPDRHISLNIKYVSNRDLLYNTGNNIQYLAIIYNGK